MTIFLVISWIIISFCTIPLVRLHWQLESYKLVLASLAGPLFVLAIIADVLLTVARIPFMDAVQQEVLYNKLLGESEEG